MIWDLGFFTYLLIALKLIRELERQELISQRFTNDFIIQPLKEVLKNINVLFDDHLYLQLIETEKGTKRALSYSCLPVGI